MFVHLLMVGCVVVPYLSDVTFDVALLGFITVVACNAFVQ
jgi:hypothetical protein